MEKFLVLYLCPTAVIETWMQTPADERKVAEETMRAEWHVWMQAHGSALTETAGAGKTKRVTKDVVTDAKNEVMLYSIVEAASHEAAADMFKDHPHFGIPEASIEVMALNYLPTMANE